MIIEWKYLERLKMAEPQKIKENKHENSNLYRINSSKI